MVSDKELLIQAAEKYAKGVAKNLFGFSTLPTQTLITYIVRNWVDKHGMIIDLLVDKDDNININMLGDALKSEMQANGGFTVGKIRFNDKDVDELLKMFNDLKNRN
jgi:hypothetical protein|nr:MAG TPA: hypothetical protein [Caudoviricetes sp.]